MKHLVIIALVVLLFAVGAMAMKSGIDTITNINARNIMQHEEIQDI